MQELLPQANAQSIPNFLWGCAELQAEPPVELQDAAAQRVHVLLPLTKAAEINQLATAFAAFGHCPSGSLLVDMAWRFEHAEPDAGQLQRVRQAYKALGLRPAAPWFSAGD